MRPLVLVSLALLPAGCGGSGGHAASAPAPAVAVTAPASGAIVSGPAVALAATATAGALEVQFFTSQGAGAVSRGDDASAPFGVTLDSTALLDGPAGIFAVARDGAGRIARSVTVSVVVDNTPPSAAIAGPPAGTVADAGGLAVTASAADASGIAKVEFFIAQGGTARKIGEDASAPYATTLDVYATSLALVDGPATLTARAVDAAGLATTSAGVPITVTDTTRAVFKTALALAPNPNASVPLAAIATFRTSIPTRATFTIEDGARTFTAAFPDLVTAHRHALLGFRPGRTNTVSVVVESAGGSTAGASVGVFAAPALPADFFPIAVDVRDAARMEPGFRVFRCSRIGGSGFRSCLCALDGEGEVAWYRIMPAGGDFERTPQGTIIYIDGNFEIAEIDMLGNEVARWHATRLVSQRPAGSVAVDCDTFHHEVSILPNGNILALSTEMRSYPGYPTSETNSAAPSATASVVGDVVVELRRDGTIVHRWPMLDVVDPYRIGYGSLDGFYNPTYGRATCDWTHGNACAYDGRDDSFTVSLRHQDAIVKIDRATGALVWILGTSANWRMPWANSLLTPTAGTEVQFHQHAVKWIPNGHLMFFDNGNYRAAPFDPKVPATSNYSRAVELAVDEQAMTFSQTWVYGGPGDEIFYSPFICDSDPLPITGNVLVTDGGRAVDASGNPIDTIQGHVSARIVEVTHTSPPEKVFQVVIDDTSPGGVSWQVYRSDLFPSLYP